MNRKVILVVLFACYLAVSVAPVASMQASGQLVVGSQHTSFGTDGEEPAPTLVENTTIRGAGESAAIELEYMRDESTATRPADTTSTTTSNQIGLTVEPKTDLAGLSLNLSSNTNGATTAYLQRASDGATLDTASISNGKAELDAEMDAGASYHVVVDADGASYTAGYYDVNEYPYTSEHIDITRAIRDGASNNYAWAIKSVTAQTAELKATGRAISANHTVENVEEGRVDLSLVNASATVEWQAWTGSAWTVVDTSTYSSTGTHSADLSGTSYQTWRADVSFETTGPDATARLHDESLLFTDHAPEIAEGSVSPSDGGEQTQKQTTLSIDVSDQEFGIAQGESVDVEFVDAGADGAVGGGDDQQIGTDTLTSNGTAQTTWDTEGNSSWYVRATDAYGQTSTSSVFTFDSPATLYLYNVSAPTELITDNADVKAEFYSGELVFERSASNGTIDFSGLPTDRSYVIKVDADGYHARTVAIESIYQQSSIYLLNETKTSSEVVFSIDDETGRFSENPELYVERGITINNSTEWRVATGNQLGATNEFVTTLETGVTYRLKVKNTDGETRILNRYTATGDDAAPIPIGQISLTSDVTEGTAFGAKLIETDQGRAVRVVYRDPAEETDQLQLEIVERGNESNVLVPNTTEVGPYGRYIATYPIANATADDISYIVRYHAERSPGDDQGGEVQVGDVPEIAKQWDIDAQILSLIGYVGILALTGLVVIRDPLAASIVAVSTATIFTMIGMVEIPPVALGIAGATALLFNVAGRK